VPFTQRKPCRRQAALAFYTEEVLSPKDLSAFYAEEVPAPKDLSAFYTEETPAPKDLYAFYAEETVPPENVLTILHRGKLLPFILRTVRNLKQYNDDTGFLVN
jgi:hypothetical protein